MKLRIPARSLILSLGLAFAGFTSLRAQPVCVGIAPAAGDGITAELVSSSLDRPVDVTAPPGDVDRVFVVEQRGRIRIIDLADDSVIARPFLDIRDRVRCCGENGLLGLAFHPNYDENGWLFVYYTRPRTGVCNANPPPGCSDDRSWESVVSRFEVGDDADFVDAGTELEILSFCQPYGNHNGGQLQFGPHDGFLYISSGDGGSGDDPCNSGQRTNSFLGKILRIDVNESSADSPYVVPSSNPFVGEGGILPEIWSLGLRNPWRFSFDSGAADGSGRGDIYIGDVGQDRWEEIDYSPGTSEGGENYEWRRMEGAHNFLTGTSLNAGVATGPVFEYNHSSGNNPGTSVTGGVVYRGCSIPALRGTYFFADFNRYWIQTFRVVDGEVTDLRDRTDDLNDGIAPIEIEVISAFGVDGRGEIYICDLSSKLFRIVPTGPRGEIPPQFRRGDANGDGVLDVSDGTRILLALFLGGPALGCLDAADSNDSGEIDVSDAVNVLSYLFLGGEIPPPPGPAVCGGDATDEDELDCGDESPCS